LKARGAANDVPVVCAGDSAGGLDAHSPLLRKLLADLGVAIVIVNHLSSGRRMDLAKVRIAQWKCLWGVSRGGFRGWW
jgi:chemotaxis response regulator CheB